MAAKTPPDRAPRKRAAPKVTLPGLPALCVAHFEEAMRLVEELVEEQTSVFIDRGQGYREQHRKGTERALSAAEAAQIAAAMASGEGLPPVALAVAVQESELRGYDEPEPMEILLAAGVATAPAAMSAVKRFVALIEMSVADLEAACESDRLDDELDAAVKAMTYAPLDGPTGARERARRAYEHFAKAAGSSQGKALSLLPRALWQAMTQATARLGLQSGPSSLTGSPPSTTGLGATSSTEPVTATP